MFKDDYVGILIKRDLSKKKTRVTLLFIQYIIAFILLFCFVIFFIDSVGFLGVVLVVFSYSLLLFSTHCYIYIIGKIGKKQEFGSIWTTKGRKKFKKDGYPGLESSAKALYRAGMYAGSVFYFMALFTIMYIIVKIKGIIY